MSTKRYQQGLGAIGWLCVILIAVFLGLCAVRMVPAYSDNQLVKSALRSLTRDVESVHTMSKGEIRQKLNSFYTINNVRGPATKALDVDRQRDKTLVKVNYEVRVPLFANVSVVMTFDNVLDSSRPQECCSSL